MKTHPLEFIKSLHDNITYTFNSISPNVLENLVNKREENSTEMSVNLKFFPSKCSAVYAVLYTVITGQKNMIQHDIDCMAYSHIVASIFFVISCFRLLWFFMDVNGYVLHNQIYETRKNAFHQVLHNISLLI